MHIPERWKHRSTRPDHSRFYMCIMWSLFCSTGIMFFAPQDVPLVVKMNPGIEHTLAMVLCLGTSCCIAGFSMGSRFFVPKADVRNAYRLAILALPSNVAALGLFAFTMARAAHWNPTLTFYSASSTVFIIIAHVWMAWDLHWEVKRLDAFVKTAIEAAIKAEDADPSAN